MILVLCENHEHFYLVEIRCFRVSERHCHHGDQGSDDIVAKVHCSAPSPMKIHNCFPATKCKHVTQSAVKSCCRWLSVLLFRSSGRRRRPCSTWSAQALFVAKQPATGDIVLHVPPNSRRGRGHAPKSTVSPTEWTSWQRPGSSSGADTC